MKIYMLVSGDSPGPNTVGKSFVIEKLKDRPDEDLQVGKWGQSRAKYRVIQNLKDRPDKEIGNRSYEYCEWPVYYTHF